MLSQETLFLSVSGVLTLNTFYDSVLYFEPVDHKFHISICLSGSTLKYLQFYRSNCGTLCIWVLGRVYVGGHWHPYEMFNGDYNGQVFLTFVLQMRKNHGKNLNQEN